MTAPQSPKGILVPARFPAVAIDAIYTLAENAGVDAECICLPDDPEARLSAGHLETITAAYFGQDINLTHARSFFSAVRKAPNIKWLHLFNAGVDHPVFSELMAKGIRLTTSAGTTAIPIARTAIAGLLMLSRHFPRWQDAQRRKRWEPIYGDTQPQDLDGQTLCILGLGAIGSELARLALMLGMSVIGIRRSPRRGEDPVDELHPPHVLAELLPRCQWLAVTCPLTPETRGLVDRDKLLSLPKGAGLINVGRGEIIDEPAMIDALRSGHLGGAYLDVFAKEPLPESSPLWDMPNVIISPHNSSMSRGNETRIFNLFLSNLDCWLRGQPMRNEVGA